jgi:3-oxoacyl-[acyl-carrier protein] reductase
MDTAMQGLVVAITGASGGIGWAAAAAFAAEGAHLALHAHSQLEALEARVAATDWRDRAICAGGDVREPAGAASVVDAAVARYGRADVLVASAGVWPEEPRPLHELSEARVRDVVATNLLGVMWSARAFLAALARSGPRPDGRGASIVLVGSTAGRFGEAGHSEYAVTKSGLRGLAASLKNEIVALDPGGRVNMVEPGWTVTPMARPSLDEPGTIERVLATMPMRQLGRVEDIAAAAVFLASPRMARHISGEILTVAGGMEGRRLWREDQIDREDVLRRLDAGN